MPVEIGFDQQGIARIFRLAGIADLGPPFAAEFGDLSVECRAFQGDMDVEALAVSDNADMDIKRPEKW